MKNFISLGFAIVAAWAALSFRARMRAIDSLVRDKQLEQLELVDDKLIKALCLVAKSANANTNEK